VEFDVGQRSPIAGRRILNLGLPPSGLIVLLHRDGHFLVPRGGAVIEGGDRLLVLTDQESLPEIRSILEARAVYSDPDFLFQGRLTLFASSGAAGTQVR